jgi:hypothetical protein
VPPLLLETEADRQRAAAADKRRTERLKARRELEAREG